MLDEIKLLIKFGEKRHLESLASGSMYFSHAQRFREFEEKLKIRGQGDRYEGASRIFAQRSSFQNKTSQEAQQLPDGSTFQITYESVDNIPVFCLFSCFERDCIVIDGGTVQININDVVQRDIVDHFVKADSALIIHNPTSFANDIRNSIKGNIKAEEVNYFHVEGYPRKEGGFAIDLDYFKYLCQDTPPRKFKNGYVYSFNADYSYRALFCKDVFFTNEQEFRILLPEDSINEPTEYKITLNESKLTLVSLEDLFNGAITTSA